VQAGVVAGTGTGLRGDYYNTTNFTGAPTLTRTDPTIDFNWGAGSPSASIPIDDFSARWYGQIQALDSDTYTFYVNSDDGVRLWVNNQELINSWILSGNGERSGTIALTANQKYPILMEYFEHQVTAEVHLRWTTTNGVFKGVAYEVIPMSQLYTNSPDILSQPALGFSASEGTNLVFTWGPGSFNLNWATNVNGPYTNVAYTGPSPFTITNAIGPQPTKFFRLQSQ